MSDDVVVFSLDYREFSEDAFKEFKRAFKITGYYFGDALEDFYGENASDTYVLYVSKRKLKKNELKEKFSFLNL